MRRTRRSASELTVVSISLRCSSLSLSHRLSSAWTKPLTPVSGERSSWATVATRSERSRSRRARPPTVADADGDADHRRQRPLAHQPGGGEHLLAAGVEPGLLGDAGAGGDAAVGTVDVQPGLAVLVLQQQHVLEPLAHGALDRGVQQPGGVVVDEGDLAADGRSEDPVGVEVGQRLEPRGPGFDDAGHRLTLVRRGPPWGGAARRRAGGRRAPGCSTGTAPAVDHRVVELGGHVVVVAVEARAPGRRAPARTRAARRTTCRWPGATTSGPTAARPGGSMRITVAAPGRWRRGTPRPPWPG